MAALKFVRSVWKNYLATSGLEPKLFEKLRVTSAVPGRIHFELDVEKHHTNTLGILHGGTLAGLVDLGGSLAVASRGLYNTGVSMDLNVTYLRSGPTPGGVLKAEAECDKFGKKIGFTQVRFLNADGELVARGSHTKYLASAFGHPQNQIEQVTEDVPP